MRNVTLISLLLLATPAAADGTYTDARPFEASYGFPGHDKSVSLGPVVGNGYVNPCLYNVFEIYPFECIAGTTGINGLGGSDSASDGAAE